MDWIRTYRLNPDWYFPQYPNNNNVNLEEVYELIKNHDTITLADKRNLKLAELFDESKVDQLEYLNKYLDVLFTNIDLTMSQSMIHIHFIEDEYKTLGEGLNQIGQIKSASVEALPISFHTIKELESWIKDVKIKNDLYIYKITEEQTEFESFFYIYHALVKKDKQVIKMDKGRKKRKK